MTPKEEIKQIAQKLGSLGGIARAKKTTKEQRREWGKMGGRPKKQKRTREKIVNCPVHNGNTTNYCPDCRPYLNETISIIVDNLPEEVGYIEVSKNKKNNGAIILTSYEGFKDEITASIYKLAQNIYSHFLEGS